MKRELNLRQMHHESIANGYFEDLGTFIEQISATFAEEYFEKNSEPSLLLTYLIRELMRNTPEHSKSDVVSVTLNVLDHNEQTVEFTSEDHGIGILKSLQGNMVHRKCLETDNDALPYAIKAGISKAFLPSGQNASSDPWANSGFGLYMVSEICRKLDGSFRLESGTCGLLKEKDEKMTLYPANRQGTFVSITFDAMKVTDSRELILETSLEGEAQAKQIRHAFKKASRPSKGLIDSI